MSKKPFSLISFPYACLLVYWFIFAGFGLLMSFLKPANLVMMHDNKLSIADFVCFYSAGKLAQFSAAQHFSIYDLDRQLELLNMLISPYKSNLIFAIPYPPQFYLAFAPIANLDLNSAFQTWTAISLFFGTAGLLCLARERKIFKPLSLLMIYAATFVSIPSQITLALGQLTWFALGLLSFFTIAFLKRRDLLAGLCLGISLLKPTVPLFLLVYVIARRRWHVLYSALATLGLLTTASLFLLPAHCFYDYIGYLKASSDSSLFFGTAAATQVNVRALLSSFLGHQAETAIAVLGALAGAIFAYFLGKRVGTGKLNSARTLEPAARLPESAAQLSAANSSGPDNQDTVSEPAPDDTELERWGLALCLVTGLLFSPHAHYHDCLLLAISAVLTLSSVSLAQSLKLRGELRFWSLSLVGYALIGFFVMLLSAQFPLMKASTLMVLNLILFVSGLRYVYTRVSTKK